jgi:3-deoxy-7-phosphoheptulonate synthase
VLRGGRAQTNYDAESIRAAEEKLKSENLPPVLMVDCSHANSEKQHARQEDVWRSVIQQRVDGTGSLIGLMVESNLHEGNQPIPKNRRTCVTACPSPIPASAGKPPNGCCAGATKRSQKRRR